MWVKSKWPKFVFLMETNCGRKRVEDIRNSMGFDRSFVVESRGLSGGLAFLWNSSDDFALESFSQTHITLLLKREEDMNELLLTGFYGHPSTSQRDGSWQLLGMLKPSNDQAWICFGDFNEILHQHEKKGAALRPYNQMDNFREVVEFCSLSDLGYEGKKFTWNNGREGPQFTKGRLDRAFGNLACLSLYSECRVSSLAAQSSDHSPLLLDMRNGRERRWSEERIRTKLFIYEASWELREECADIIQSSWNQNQGWNGTLLRGVQNSLERCKTSLLKWSKEKLRKQKLEIQ